jgi:hypothetical protein
MQSPFSETSSCSDSPETFRTLWISNVYCRVRKIRSLVPTQCRMRPVDIVRIYFNISPIYAYVS